MSSVLYTLLLFIFLCFDFKKTHSVIIKGTVRIEVFDKCPQHVGDYVENFCFDNNKQFSDPVPVRKNFTFVMRTASFLIRMKGVMCEECIETIANSLLVLKCELTNNMCLYTALDKFVESVLEEYFGEKGFHSCFPKEFNSTINIGNSFCDDVPAGLMEIMKPDPECKNQTKDLIVMLLAVALVVCFVFFTIAICGIYKRGQRMMVELQKDTQHRSRLQLSSSVSTVNPVIDGTPEGSDVEDGDDTIPDVVNPLSRKPTNFPMVENPLNRGNRNTSLDSGGYVVPDMVNEAHLYTDLTKRDTLIEDNEGYVLPDQQFQLKDTVNDYLTIYTPECEA